MTPTPTTEPPHQPRPWSDVQSDPDFQQLDPDRQAIARRQYFDQLVAPRIPEPERRGAPG